MSWLKSLISPITNLAGKMIMDKDKFAELQFRKLELEYNAKKDLLKQTTTPKIDAVVKLLITINDVVIPLLRPLGAAAMTAFGIYMHAKGTPMEAISQAIFDGAFPAWGASRHVNKQTEAKKRTHRRPVIDDEDDDLFNDH
jgi:hypothetical protein